MEGNGVFPSCLTCCIGFLSVVNEKQRTGWKGKGSKKEAPISSKNPLFFFFFAGAYRDASQCNILGRKVSNVHTVCLFTLSKDLCMPEHDKVLGGDRFSGAVGTHSATS